jgi:hypothetical protein
MPHSPNNKTPRVPHSLAQVISAQRVSTSRASPYVEIEVFGLPSEYRRHRTRTVNGNGLNPYWPEPEVLQCTVRPIGGNGRCARATQGLAA